MSTAPTSLVRTAIWFGWAGAFLVLSYAPHYGGLSSLLSFTGIVFSLRIALGADWRAGSGLAIPGRDLALAAGLFALLFVVDRQLIHAVLERRGAELVETGLPFNRSYLQTLNEELLAGAVPLLWSRLRRWRGSAVLVALIFALAHDVVSFGRLEPLTVVSLAAVGVVRNVLIVRAGHVAFAWAFHLAWNLTFFRGALVFEGASLDQPDRFNLVLGEPWVALVTVLLAVTLWGLPVMREQPVSQ
jgi:hypothetical protein